MNTLKKKITNPLKLVALCFITSFLWNCEQEENFPTNEKNLAKENFTLKNFKNPFIKENLVVNWNNFNEKIGKKTTTYEFTTSFKVPFYVEKRGQKIPIKYKILATKTVADTWDYKLIKLFPSPKSNTKMAKYSNSNAFTGIATHYNLKGEKTQYNTYNKGEIIGSIKNNGNKGIRGRLSFDDIKNLRAPGMLTFKDFNYKNDYNVEHHYGSYMPVRTEHYIDWYKKIDGQYIFLGSKLQYVSHEYTYVPNNHHYTNGYHPNDNVYYEHHTGTGKIPQHIYDNFKEKQIREILSEPTLSLKSQEIEYENKIKNYIQKLKQFGNPEDEIFAEYLDSLIPFDNTFSKVDKLKIYQLAQKQVHGLFKKYLKAIVVPVSEATYPFIVYALTEATLGVALPLISKMPVSMVIRGARLNRMVKKMATLGKAGTSSRVRLIPNGNYLKSIQLFNKLTKNAKSIKVEKLTNGRVRRIADMGDKNFITFRNFDYSNTPNLVANIDLKFHKIWIKTRELKFIK